LAKSEHTEARYDVQEVEMGQVYTWRPESIEVECDCGERLTLTASATTCARAARITRSQPQKGWTVSEWGTRRRTPGAIRKTAETLGYRTKSRKAPTHAPRKDKAVRNHMGSVLEVEDVLGVGALVMTMLGLLGVAVWFCCSIVGNIVGTRRRLKDSRYEALLGENERLKGFWRISRRRTLGLGVSTFEMSVVRASRRGPPRNRSPRR
jgi:hypothetical protein